MKPVGDVSIMFYVLLYVWSSKSRFWQQLLTRWTRMKWWATLLSKMVSRPCNQAQAGKDIWRFVVDDVDRC